MEAKEIENIIDNLIKLNTYIKIDEQRYVNVINTYRFLYKNSNIFIHCSYKHDFCEVWFDKTVAGKIDLKYITILENYYKNFDIIKYVKNNIQNDIRSKKIDKITK